MRIDPRSPRAWAFALLALLLLASIPSYALFLEPADFGLDLHNVQLFHTCVARDDPYVVPPDRCGDPLGRVMPYPPLMYWAFVWTRCVSFPAARILWASCIAAILLGAGWVWSGAQRLTLARWRQYLFAVLLVLQFPAIFAMQRGNNDTFVVLLWSCASLFLLRRRPLLAGCAVGLAAAAKLYPMLGCAVLLAGVLGGVLRDGLAAARPGARLVAGMLLAPAAVTLAFWTQSRHYVRDVLPVFAARMPAESLLSHSVPATLGVAAGATSALLALTWCAAAFSRMRTRPQYVLAGALAISTYVARTSFDYALVTVYPLLLVQLAQALEAPPRTARWSFAVLALGLLSVAGHRGWFAGHPTIHVGLQIAWLLASAALVIAVRPVDDAPGDVRPATAPAHGTS